MIVIKINSNLNMLKTASQIKNEKLIVKNQLHIVWKLLKMSHLNFIILAFSTNFCPIKTDLSGNTVWPQASGFQKLTKMELQQWNQLIFSD